MSYNLPCPSLVGLILVASTHNGPHFSFCYPPELASDEFNRRKPASSELDDEDYVHEEMGETPDESLDFNHMSTYLGTKKDILSVLDSQERLKREGGDTQSASSLHNGRSSLRQVTSNSSKASASSPEESSKIMGFEREYLSEMLCPPRLMCNSRFEVMIENVVFLGLPVHIGADGSWRPGKLERKREKPTEEDETVSKNAMSMFHLVFVLKPPEIERNYRIDEMFYCVTSKLSLVLRYEQLKRDYVWSQIRLILQAKEEWRTQSTLHSTLMLDYVVSKLSLCKLMVDCYEAISTSKIATLLVNNKRKSFQIPVKLEFASLPEPTVPYIPGSYLSSTANMLSSTGLVNLGETTRYHTKGLMNLLLDGSLATGNYGAAEDINSLDDEDSNGSSSEDIIYFAILLLDSPENIIKDLKAEPQGQLARFIRLIRPTESLIKLTNKMKSVLEEKSFSIAHVKSFAFQLIYWRKARVVPPLNSRAIYIISPMAPFESNLRKDIRTFKNTFSTLPSLPQFLKLLSTRSRKPKQFATIIPSRDHKELYLSALAWLIRYGYVTQLHTYIWLKIPRKVKMRVEEEEETERGRDSKKKRGLDTAKNQAVVDNKVEVDNKVDNKVDSSGDPASSPGKAKTLPQKGFNPSSLDSEIEKIESKLGMASIASNVILEEEDDTILVDPGRASSTQRRWINRVIHEECKLTPDLTAVFYKILKYMNGKNSLEILLLKENVSRVELRKLLLAIEDYIISVRHW